MLKAWLVTRVEKHIGEKFWVCFDREDAVKIANDVASYWIEEYACKDYEIDRECYGDFIFYADVDDLFRVTVQPQNIRERGQTGTFKELTKEEM